MSLLVGLVVGGSVLSYTEPVTQEVSGGPWNRECCVGGKGCTQIIKTSKWNVVPLDTGRSVDSHETTKWYTFVLRGT